MRLIRPALCLALAATAGSSVVAFAVDAPKSSNTSKTLYAARLGCGTTTGEGRLEEKVEADDAPGCGTIGGLPFAEVFAQLGDPTFVDFTSTSKMKPFKVDATKKVTGQVTVKSWIGRGAGGIGQVAVDIKMVATTVAGKTVDFGAATLTAAATPGKDSVELPFSLAVPTTAAGSSIKTVVFSYAAHGANIGMSARGLDGATYVVLPAKK